ncbi:hypothetical protein F5X99DRAFT_413434 [Biscogniauxia marginata]|nr:hypothetical protein F5X99DRAFT_413434 [Biscogniauxia marginata]
MNVEKSPLWGITNDPSPLLDLFIPMNASGSCEMDSGLQVKITKLLHDNVASILYERRTGMYVLISEDILTPLYQSGLLMASIYPQLFDIMAGVAHSNPNLCILEIGGSTNGAIRIAMKAISPGFLSSAREFMTDPMEQGDEQAYDLIACQVFITTSNMPKTLSNCRKLLRLGGRLILVKTN